MKKILATVVLTLFGFGCTTSPLDISEDNICQGLLDLAIYSRTKQQAIETVLIKDRGEIGCGYSPPNSIKTFCEIVIANTSWEFVNRFPMAISTCISKNGTVANIQLSDDWSGLKGESGKKIIKIKGSLNVGGNVDLIFEPNIDNNPANFYGRYNLTLTPRITD